jgi:hypothetical protein
MKLIAKRYGFILNQEEADYFNGIIEETPELQEAENARELVNELFNIAHTQPNYQEQEIIPSAPEFEEAPTPEPEPAPEPEPETMVKLDLSPRVYGLLKKVCELENTTPEKLLIDKMFLSFCLNGPSDFFKVPNREAMREFLKGE